MGRAATSRQPSAFRHFARKDFDASPLLEHKEHVSSPPLIFDRALWRKRLTPRPAGGQRLRFSGRARRRRACIPALDHQPGFSARIDLGSPHPAIAAALAAPGRLVVRAAPVTRRPFPRGGSILSPTKRRCPSRRRVSISSSARSICNSPTIRPACSRRLAASWSRTACFSRRWSVARRFPNCAPVSPRRRPDRGRRQPARLALRGPARSRRPAAARRPRVAGDRLRFLNRALLRRLRPDARPARDGGDQCLVAGARRPLRRDVLLRRRRFIRRKILRSGRQDPRPSKSSGPRAGLRTKANRSRSRLVRRKSRSAPRSGTRAGSPDAQPDGIGKKLKPR